MFSHVMLGSNDLARSKKFYDAVLGTVGAAPGTTDARGRLAYRHDGGTLMVTKPIDGQSATHANGGTLGFKTSSPEQLMAWHRAGVENGGVTCEDAPGPRSSGVHLAYLRDPDGNKLCAVYRGA